MEFDLANSLERYSSEKALDYYLSLRESGSKAEVALIYASQKPDLGRALCLWEQPAALQRAAGQARWHRVLRKAFLQKRNTIGLQIPEQILPKGEGARAFFLALSGDWTELRRSFCERGGLETWLEPIPENFHFRLVRSLESEQKSSSPSQEDASYLALVQEVLLTHIRRLSSTEKLKLLAEGYGHSFGGELPAKLDSLDDQDQSLSIYLSQGLPDVWQHLDLLREHPLWRSILEALFELSPERVIKEVSPSEFALLFGHDSPSIQAYVEPFLLRSSAEWSKGMTVGWMRLVVDSLDSKSPWPKHALTSLRRAFEGLPYEVLPLKARLGLSLASENWGTTGLREFLKERSQPELTESPPDLLLEDLPALQEDVQDLPDWICRTPISSAASSLLWLEYVLRENLEKPPQSLRLLADLPFWTRSQLQHFKMSLAQKKRYLAAFDRLLNLKIRKKNVTCDALYPLFHFLGSHNHDFRCSLDEIYALCTGSTSYRSGQVTYPDFDSFWCWECADWLPLERRSKYNQCALCHRGGN